MEGDRVVVHHLDLVTRDLSTLVVEGESKLAAPFGLLMRLLRSNENFTSSAVMSDHVLEDDVLLEVARVRLRVGEVTGLGQVCDRFARRARSSAIPE